MYRRFHLYHQNGVIILVKLLEALSSATCQYTSFTSSFEKKFRLIIVLIYSVVLIILVLSALCVFSIGFSAPCFGIQKQSTSLPDDSCNYERWSPGHKARGQGHKKISRLRPRTQAQVFS